MKSVQDNIVYSVWVGDGEVNEDYINEYEIAVAVAAVWKSRGYDDTAIEELEIDPRTGDVVSSRLVG